MEGFLRYRIGGPISGGAYTWKGLFSEFYGMLFNSYSPKAKFPRRSRGDYSTILTEPEPLVYSHKVISTESERKPLKNDSFD